MTAPTEQRNYGFPYRIEAKGEHSVRWTLACQCHSLEDGRARLAEYEARAGQPVPGDERAIYYPFVRLTDDRRRPVEAQPPH